MQRDDDAAGRLTCSLRIDVDRNDAQPVTRACVFQFELLVVP